MTLRNADMNLRETGFSKRTNFYVGVVVLALLVTAALIAVRLMM